MFTFRFFSLVIALTCSTLLSGCIEVTYVDSGSGMNDSEAVDSISGNNIEHISLSNQEGKAWTLQTKLSSQAPGSSLTKQPAQEGIEIFASNNHCPRANKDNKKTEGYRNAAPRSYLVDISADKTKIKHMAEQLTSWINEKSHLENIQPDDDDVPITEPSNSEYIAAEQDIDLDNGREYEEGDEEDKDINILIDKNDAGSDQSTEEPETGTFEQLEKPLDPLFTDQHFCNDATVLLAESMSLSMLEKLCADLKAVEERFHDVMQTHYQVVDGDQNDLIEIRIFDSYFSYLNKIKDVSGLTYNSSGGFFYEGFSSKEGNRAKIYVFEKTFSNGVWNLTHEYIHHLNARYIKHGNVSNKAYYLFWEEGIAEYFSQQPGFADARFALLSQFTIDDIISVDENATQTATYGWSYWFIRYLIEQESDRLFELSYHLQQGEFSAYKALLDQIAEDNDAHFQQWLNDQ